MERRQPAVAVVGISPGFWRGKAVFVTGHTGFKGAWLCEALRFLGASVTGYALAAAQGGVYDVLALDKTVASYIGDIRDCDALKAVFDRAKPEIVFHLAAQPLVLEAYTRPAYTFDVNAQGTVNMLECARGGAARSVVVVTTDKVYRNEEWVYGYRERDALGDTEPYAASKACAEIATESYAATFLRPLGVAVSTVRAGNVIGGGDVSAHRIVPDCVRAAKNNAPIIVRNRHAVRPYQHVLEPLFAYILLAQGQWENPGLAGQYNIGPAERDCVTTAELADMFCDVWGDARWRDASDPAAPRESGVLKLDCAKFRAAFGWESVWPVRDALRRVAEWEKAGDKAAVTAGQIEEYSGLLLGGKALCP